MGKMLPSLSLTSVSNFDFGSECLVVNINIQNQDWQISFSKSKLNIQDYALGCQYQDSNSRFKSCISRLVLNFNICKFAWQYSIPKSKSLQTSNSTSISRILSISTSKSTNINNFAHLWCEMGCPLLRARSKKLLMFPFFIGLRQMAGIVIGSNDGGANMALESKTT